MALDLSGTELTKWPTGIVQFKDLKILRLSDNKLDSLPKEIGQLNSLISLKP